jgi:hypothetical protein
VTAALERRLLQIVIALACIVPLTTGGQGIVRGAAMLRGMPQPVPADVDSHFRYLCGIFFVVGCAFVSCIPDVARKGSRFRLLGAMVVAGGLARLLSLGLVGVPSPGHRFGLVMELGVVPLLMLWQARVARRA